VRDDADWQNAVVATLVQLEASGVGGPLSSQQKAAKHFQNPGAFS
jgi:hypothetical protein